MVLFYKADIIDRLGHIEHEVVSVTWNNGSYMVKQDIEAHWNRLDMVIKKVSLIGETLYIVQIFYYFFLIFLECMQSC